ncbi:MAG: tyrosine-type recombinase/integrase [Ignavibacteriaceae bacterium]
MEITEVINQYMEYLRGVRRYSGYTIKAYNQDLNSFSEFCADHSKIEINSVSEKIIKSFLMHLNDLGLEMKSISRKMASLRGLFKYAFQQDIIAHNPAFYISNPKAARKLPEIISKENFSEIYKEVDKDKEDSKLIKVIFELLYGCSLRVSELCQLNRNDLDINKKILRVKGKGSKVRISPVGGKSIAIINDYLNTRNFKSEKEPLLINKNSKRIYPRLVHRIVNKYLSRITDIKKKSPHILRHSSATHMLDSGANLEAVKEILGHENLSTTQIYTHVSIERLKATYKKSHPKS